MQPLGSGLEFRVLGVEDFKMRDSGFRGAGFVGLGVF